MMKKLSRVTLVVLMLMLGTFAFAKNKQYELQLGQEVQVSGVQLKPGTYQVEIDGNSLVFYKGKKEVAKVAVRTEEQSKKIESTSSTVEKGQLKAVELAGTKTRLIVEGQ